MRGMLVNSWRVFKSSQSCLSDRPSIREITKLIVMLPVIADLAPLSIAFIYLTVAMGLVKFEIDYSYWLIKKIPGR